MLKYASILALSLCACASTAPIVQPLAHVEVASEAPLPPPSTPPATVTVVEPPVTIELARGREAQVLRCSDELDCFQKLTGVCANGYNGGQMLHSGNDRVVGVIFRCITDQEKADAAQQEANEKEQEAVWKAARAQALQDAQKAHDAKPTTKTTTPKK